MKKLAFALAAVLVTACSGHSVSPSTPSGGILDGTTAKVPVKATASSGGVSMKVYGSPMAFKQTRGEIGLAYDGKGGLWIASPTAFERFEGSNTYVLTNGFHPTSATDAANSTNFIVPLNGYVYGIGFDQSTPALVRISPDGSRSVFHINGLDLPCCYGFRAVAAGANAIYGIYLNGNGVAKIARISAYGVLLNATTLQAGNSYNSFESLTVNPSTGDAYVVEDNRSTITDGRVDRLTPTGAFVTSYPYGYLADAVGIHTTSVAFGNDGMLYIPSYDTSTSSGAIVQLDPNTGKETAFATPSLSSEPMNSVVAGDGNVWFVEYSANKLARITSAGQITEYSEPLPYPLALAAAPKGATENPASSLWFTSYTDYFDSVEATF